MSGQPITVSEEYLNQLCAAVAEKAAKAAAETATATAFAAGFQAGSSSGPATAPTTSSTNRSRKPKKEKTTDNYELDHTRTIIMDNRDPRAMGHGPCGTEHFGKQTGNQWARWTDCAKCGLRIEYVPYKHSPSMSTRTENPKDVHDALEELAAALIWEDMDAKRMQAKIKEIAHRKMQDRPGRRTGPQAKAAPQAKANPQAKAKSRAAHYNLNEATAPTEAEEPMEEYGDEDWEQDLANWTADQTPGTA